MAPKSAGAFAKRLGLCGDLCSLGAAKLTLGQPDFMRYTLLFCLICSVASCAPVKNDWTNELDAPGRDLSKSGENAVEVGHRLIAAGEYELALRAFARAALERDKADAEILLGMGTANLGLGRLRQAENILRLALEKKTDWPEIYNNLGVVLMEQKKTLEAAGLFRKAFALDRGQSESIRKNLRLALSQIENPSYPAPNNNEFRLVRRGSGEYLIRRTP
jgi:tetratricopeptide (TPR) repeat protein